MSTIVYLVLIAALLTAISLAVGVYSMALGGDFDEKHSNQFMFARVGSQAAALAFMVIAMMSAS